MPKPKAAKKSRADASNNRELLLDAARELFLAQGTEAPLDLISKRAGVGRATFFRNFPDRQALLLALLERALDQLEAEATTLEDDPEAFLKLLRFGAERILANGPLIEYWRAMNQQSAQLKAASARFIEIFSRPMRRAVRAGQCRADLKPPDILLLFALLSARAIHASNNPKKLAARTWVLMLAAAGFKPER